MEKFSFLLFFFFFNAYGTIIKVYQAGEKKDYNLESFPLIEVDSTNYAPSLNYSSSKFSGALVNTILKNYKLNDTDTIHFIDKSLEFVVSVNWSELKQGSIIAYKRNSKKIEKNRGNSLIWPNKFLMTKAESKRRQYSCWWVKHIVIGSKGNKNIHRPFKAALKFPVPRGFNISNTNNFIKEVSGKLYSNVNKIKFTDINGKSHQVNVSGKDVLFSEHSFYENPRLGGKTLYIINERKGNEIINFKQSLFFINTYEII